MAEPALKTFDESTWKDIEEDKERLAMSKAIIEFYRALSAFTDAQPGGRWRDRRVEFGRLIKDKNYASAYDAGYLRGKRSSLRQTLGQDVDTLKKDLLLFVPNMLLAAEIYLAPPGQKPTDRQLRDAIGPDNAAALDIYTSSSGVMGVPQSREDLLKNTWFKGGVAVAKLLDDVERQGWLTTLDFTAAELIAGLQRLSEAWVEGFFALNGQPDKQGEYVGRMVGAAIALVIWMAANFIAFEAVFRTCILVNEGVGELYVAVRKLTLMQRIALLAARTKALLEWIERALSKDLPDIFYRVFVRGEPKALDRFLNAARSIRGGSFINRARRLKGSHLLEELIPFNANYDTRVRGIEQFLANTADSIWQPKAYRARRIWVWQMNDYSGTSEWMELSDSALVVLPKSGAKTKFRIGLANVFESKSAGVVEKAASDPEFLAGQMGKNFERLDFDPKAYDPSKPVIRVEVEGLGVGSDPTIVELKPGELFFSRLPLAIEKTTSGEKRTFGTFWTVVTPPDAKPATLIRTFNKLQDNGFKGGEIWLHPMTDAKAQRISEAVLDFADQNP